MTERIITAARWLATTPDAKRPRPLIPYITVTFDLTSAEAVAAIRESHLILARAG